MKHTMRCLLWLAFILSSSGSAISQPLLTVHSSTTGLELAWPALVTKSNGAVERPFFEVQRSQNLQDWQPIGQRLRASSMELNQWLRLSLNADEPQAFYRLLTVLPPATAKLSTDGAEIFGYHDALVEELKSVGQISIEQFGARFASDAAYLLGLSWDPTTARFWEAFNADPDVVNQNLTEGQLGYRTMDFRLSPTEQNLFRKNGFVVSERLGGDSFAQVFYQLWHNDLPVFISTDALLQAWHRTYDAMLEEIEETFMYQAAQTLLDGMAAQVSQAAVEVGKGVLHDSLMDADYFLTVARSLLTGTNLSPALRLSDQTTRVAVTLNDIRAEQLKQVPDFMGFCRMVDYSQFKVRGHYTHTERLSRYFQCMMWLGRIDVPVAGHFARCSGEDRKASPRELGLAIVLWHLLNASGQFITWSEMERIINTFVGRTDSLNFGQLYGVLAGAGIHTLTDVRDTTTLERIQADLERGELGVQNITSDWFEAAVSGIGGTALPQTFTVFGQKFVPDSWAFSELVSDRIDWNGIKVDRRVPGALDIAFAVLGNNQVVPELIAQMQGVFPNPDRPHAAQFRDGLPYQHNLAAVRNVLDRQTTTTRTSNIYQDWLTTLRMLSAPTTDTRYPEAMRTRAWAMKTLNTQLASWTQLRHDTILYTKPSFTLISQCVYPHGFVEPRLEFWNYLRQMATRAAESISRLNLDGSYSVVAWCDPQFDPVTGKEIVPGQWQTNLFTFSSIRERQVTHLGQFAHVVERLEALARKELNTECFTPEDEQWIDGLMEQPTFPGGCGGPIKYTGWYPQLFYRTIFWTADDYFHMNFGAGARDTLVTDVHTDVPCEVCGDRGSVLHEAVGVVNLLLLAVDNGADRFICAGPVLSHYEFEVIGNLRRLSDTEWRTFMSPGSYLPGVPRQAIEGLAPPPWTRGFLVPNK